MSPPLPATTFPCGIEADTDDDCSYEFSDNFVDIPQTQQDRITPSKEHIDRLEAKLKRVAGKQEEPTARSMLKILSEAKDDLMRGIVSGNDISYVFVSNPDKETAVSYLERKLYPEKTALSSEELISLVIDDELAKHIQQHEEVKNHDDAKSGGISAHEQTSPKMANHDQSNAFREA
ncbi:PREDICTED: uncharacterized protein LOC106809380 [Priapulus caudatus]|uniref:Uncharacterized protein LOC106809380 n=1 Tax=Priapulus caudatus TaxID=37621 RepID=A0ABM1E6W0_PRICU|nr:PREDICTED: uncharacterized protein LOC106809380 [Priapulus caudatus]